MAEDVIEATSFAITPRDGGPILSVIVNRNVAANIKLSTSLIWLLARSLNQALADQHLWEQRMKLQKEGTGERSSQLAPVPTTRTPAK
jgi:hypothetical protein